MTAQSHNLSKVIHTLHHGEWQFPRKQIAVKTFQL